MKKFPVRIIGTGCYLPSKCLSNDMLQHICGVSPEWILRRTGIQERRMAAREEASSHLAIHAAQQALESAHMTGDDLDFILVATSTPDTIIPSTASRIQAALCNQPVPGYDCSSACAGFLFALMSGVSHIAAGLAQRVLVIGAEVRSRFTDYKDPNTAILYGDGAGAVILAHSDEDDPAGFIHFSASTDGNHGNLVCIPAGGSQHPATHETVDAKQHFVQLDGTTLFRIGVRTMVDSIEEALFQSGLQKDDIALYIPHQMNLRMLHAIAERLHIPESRFFMNVQDYGNTSAATIPIALAEAVRQGRIHPGDRVCLATFGGGLSWGTAIVKW